ncbi:MAG: 50S ribosomal protein L29 [Acidobacteriota bacterium]
MEPEKIRELETKELEGQAGEVREQLFHLRFKIGMGQSEGLKKYRALRKDRARILSILRERQAAAQKEGNQ